MGVLMSASTIIDRLTEMVGPRVSVAPGVLSDHGRSEAYHASQPPDVVVFPETTQELAAIVKLCADLGMPIVPFGAGTSLEGNAAAVAGGVCFDFARMNKILKIHDKDMDVVVQPGITRKQLNAQLRDTGLFFPIDPGADASIGGMASTRASGTMAVRYGTMKDNVLSLKVVLANGEVMSTARRAKKTASGYDLTRLIVGSEGTLGVITELTLRLAGIPEAISSGVCPFPSVEAACNATILTIQSGIPVARIELLDALQVHACNLYSKLNLPETPMLFLEFHGSDASVAEQSQRFGEIAKEFGGGPFDWATKAEDRSRLWQARHDAYWAQRGLRPNTQPLATDVCVPISRLAECLAETQSDIAESKLLAPIVGHVGDGNFHVGLLVDMNDEDEVTRVRAFLERLTERALAMDGTCTGEHGIGQGKMKYLPSEYGAPALDVMRAIKRALDPLDIMNPGKIFTL
jgi:D-lactate dehydrogenase (cytochrome)